MRKRIKVLAATLALSLSPAFALDLGGVLDAIAPVVCGSGSLGFSTPLENFAFPIGSLGDLQGFCRAYSVYKRYQSAADILKEAGRLALQNLIRGTIDGVFEELGVATRGPVGMVSDFLGELADKANTVLNLPYLMAGEVYNLAYASAYNEIYKSLQSSSGASPRVPASSLNIATSAPALKDRGSSEVKADFAYADAAELGRKESATKESLKETAELASEAVRAEDNARALAEAQAAAEEAAKEAEKAASREAVRQALSGQAEVAQKLAEAATQVTANDPVTGQKGKAQQYREEAASAPSDRALLELQVKALADIMEQNAIYMPYIADLLVQQSKVQAMTTMELKEAITRLSEEVREPVRMATSEETINRTWEQMVERAEADIEPMRALFKAACNFYSGGSPTCGP